MVYSINSFDVVYLQDTFMYLLYVKGGNVIELRSMDVADQPVVKTYKTNLVIRSVTPSLYNRNAVIVTLYDALKPYKYSQYNLMVDPCIASTALPACLAKHTVCTTCAPDHVLVDDLVIIGSKYCSLKKNGKWCLDGYF